MQIEANVTANTAYLPELSVKPYFSYGLGIQRVFGERFTAYGQIMLRNGGRNGIAANAGMRYLFGHETKTDEEAEKIFVVNYVTICKNLNLYSNLFFICVLV